MPVTRTTRISIVYIAVVLGAAGVLLLQQLMMTAVVPVAFIGAESGLRSDLGVAARNAARMAVDEVNQEHLAGRYRLDLHVFDNKGSPEICAEVLDTVRQESIRHVIGPLTSNMIPALEPTLAQNDTLVLSPTISSPLLSARDDMFLRMIPDCLQQADIIAAHILDQGGSRICLVYDPSNREYSWSVTDRACRWLTQKGKEPVLIAALDSSVSFERLAADMKEKSVSDILFVCSGLDAARIARQIGRAGLRCRLYGTMWACTWDLPTQGGRDVESMVLVSPDAHFGQPEQYSRFLQEYRKRFKQEPVFSAQYAYEAVYVLAAGLKEGGRSPQAVKAAILSKGRFDGVSDTIVFDRYGDVSRSYALYRITDGKFVGIKKIDGQTTRKP